MNYEQDIIRILQEAGRCGLPVKKIARHVYNMNNGLFDSVPFEKVYQDVLAFINKNNKSKCPVLKKTGKWGYYSLSNSSKKVIQQTFNFDEGYPKGEEDDTPTVEDIDLSLSLFD